MGIVSGIRGVFSKLAPTKTSTVKQTYQPVAPSQKGSIRSIDYYSKPTYSTSKGVTTKTVSGGAVTIGGYGSTRSEVYSKPAQQVVSESVGGSQQTVQKQQIQAPSQEAAKRDLYNKIGIQQTSGNVLQQSIAAGKVISANNFQQGYLARNFEFLGKSSLGGRVRAVQERDINRQILEFKQLRPEEAARRATIGQEGYYGQSTNQGTQTFFFPKINKVSEFGVFKSLSPKQKTQAIYSSFALGGTRVAETFFVEAPIVALTTMGRSNFQKGEVGITKTGFYTPSFLNEGAFKSLKSQPTDIIQKGQLYGAIGGTVLAGGVGLKNIYIGERLAGSSRARSLGLAFGELASGVSPIQPVGRVFISENVGMKDYAQFPKGSLIKQDVLGRINQYQVSTIEGKPTSSTLKIPEAAQYGSMQKYYYGVYKPYITGATFKTGTIYSPKFALVSTQFGSNIFGTKSYSGGVAGSVGTGGRIVQEFGFTPQQTGTYSIGNRGFFNIAGEKFVAVGASQQLTPRLFKTGGKAYFYERFSYKYKAPIGNIPSEYSASGVKLGRTTAQTYGFDTIIGKVRSPEAIYTFGKSYSIGQISGRQLPLYFRTITRTPLTQTLNIESSGGTTLFQRTTTLSAAKTLSLTPPSLKTAVTPRTSSGLSQVGRLFSFEAFASASAGKSLTKSTQVVKQVSSTVQTPTTVLTTGQIVSTTQINIPRLASGSVQIPRTAQTQVQTQKQTQIFGGGVVFGTPAIPPLVSTIAPLVPFFPPLLPKLSFDETSRVRRIRGKKQRKKYTPDYPSLILGTRGKAIKTFTGLERRPIPKGFSFAFGRAGF